MTSHLEGSQVFLASIVSLKIAVVFLIRDHGDKHPQCLCGKRGRKSLTKK